MVAAPGFEPGTPWVWTACSSQLSYTALRLINFGGGERIWTFDLRVMSPTSFQTAPPRDAISWCRTRDLNPHGLYALGILSPVCLPFHQPGRKLMVRRRRIELLRHLIGHKILSLARLPIPPPPHLSLRHDKRVLYSEKFMRQVLYNKHNFYLVLKGDSLSCKF